jgi:hypothetical protein
MKLVPGALILSLMLGTACSSGSSGSKAGTGGRTGTGTGGLPGGSGGAPGAGTGGSPSGPGGSGTGGAGAGGASATGGMTASGGGSTATGGSSNNGGMSGAAAGASGQAGAGQVGTGGAPVACMAPLPLPATGTAATVTVNLAAPPTATVGPDLMGIHSSIYDGTIGSPSTADLLRAVGVTSIRYPGGSIGDVYHFENHLMYSMVPTSNSPDGFVYVAPEADFGKFVSILQNVGANALITINYGSNPSTNGPGLPEEAAAWVAYANALPSNTTAIGLDTSPTPRDWMTAGYWAGLRASAPLAIDDGLNYLRINHPAPVGIKYWEIGNEIYGNGFFGAGVAWEADMHALPGAPRQGAAGLSPATYGRAVATFAALMKKVDPTVKVGGIVNWPDNRWANFNRDVMTQECSSIDFVVNHYYAGTTIASLLTAPGTDIPTMFRDLHALLTANCPAGRGATMPIAITEWSPNPNDSGPIQDSYNAMPMTHTQTFGIFAANGYATFMEQGALMLHWHELHGKSYIPNTAGVDAPTFGYHGAQIAHYFAAAGDSLLPQPVVTNATTLASLLLTHASKHADDSVSVMLTNASPTVSANVTLNVTGGALGCVGTSYTYAPVSAGMDLDGSVVAANIFSSATGAAVPVVVPPYSVVVIHFPNR